MLAGDFIAFPRLDAVIVPIQVIDLQLDEFRLRELGQDPVQRFRVVVEGETEMADLAFLLLLLTEAEDVEIPHHGDIAPAQSVQQIVIEIPGTGLLQLLVKVFLEFGFFFQEKYRHLVGQQEGFTRMTFHQDLF